MIDIAELGREWEQLKRNPELAPFIEMRNAARQGRAPDPEVVKAIADAAEFLFGDEPARERLEAFGRALGIVPRPGKGRRPDDSRETMRARSRHVDAIIQDEFRLIALGESRRSARAQALRDTAARECIPLRTLTRWVGELRASTEHRYLKHLRDLRAAMLYVPDPDFDPEPMPEIDPELARNTLREIDTLIPLLESSRHD